MRSRPGSGLERAYFASKLALALAVRQPDATSTSLSGAAGAGGAGSSGAPAMGRGGGDVAAVPPGGVCSPNATKCEGNAHQTSFVEVTS